jgi:hypothetical protein
MTKEPYLKWTDRLEAKIEIKGFEILSNINKGYGASTTATMDHEEKKKKENNINFFLQ